MSRIILVNQSSTPDDAGSGNAQLFIEGNELYQQVGTGDKTKVANETTSTFTSSLSAPSVSAVNTAKAWIHFNGENTISIVTAYNVSSIADEGEGDYTLTFTTAFPNANYCVIGGAHRKSGDSQIRVFGTYDATAMATGSCRINSQYSGGNSADSNRVQVLIFSD